jgi:ATP-dependent exoDNAse (exonuclease V) beta subunit
MLHNKESEQNLADNLGSRENPIHQSSLNKLIDDTSYAPDNCVWEKTVAGSTVHEYLEHLFAHGEEIDILEAHKKQKSDYNDAGIKVLRSRFDAEKFLLEMELKIKHILLPKFINCKTWYCEYLFRFKLFGLWFEGIIDYIGLGWDKFYIFDWKTAQKVDSRKTCQHLIYQLALHLGSLTKNYTCDANHKITIEPNAKWLKVRNISGFFYVDLMNMKSSKSKIFINASRSFEQALYESTPIIHKFALKYELKNYLKV